MRYRHDKLVLAPVMLVLGLAACSGGGTTSPGAQGGNPLAVARE